MIIRNMQMPQLDPNTHPIEIFAGPADGRRHPMVMVLHGNFGLGPTFGPLILDFARRISALGYVVAAPRYYPDAEPHFSDDQPEQHVPVLTAAIADVAERPDADSDQLGLVGFSLGAAIAMSFIGANAPGRSKVLVDFFGPLPANIKSGSGHFPPTAIFHNRLDTAVGFEHSLDLCRMLPHALEVRFSGFTENNPPYHHVFDPVGYAQKSSDDEARRWVVQHLPPLEQ